MLVGKVQWLLRVFHSNKSDDHHCTYYHRHYRPVQVMVCRDTETLVEQMWVASMWRLPSMWRPSHHNNGTSTHAKPNTCTHARPNAGSHTTASELWWCMGPVRRRRLYRGHVLLARQHVQVHK